MRRLYVTTAILCAIALAGCSPADLLSKNEYSNEEVPVADIATLGYVPAFEYERPVQRSSITTDRVGYSPSGKKVIYIEGTELSKDYKIIKSGTDEVVFEGRLYKVSENKDESGPVLYMGDFTDLNKTGVYRVFQPDVGYSYSFSIDNESHKNLYKQVYETITDAEYISTSGLIYTLSNLMMTREIYKNAYTNDSFIKGGITVLLNQQHPKSGAVYQELQDEQTLALITEELKDPNNATIQTDTMISLSATAELAGVMAQYYCDYYETDEQGATDALRAAGKAYSYVEKYRDNVTTDSMYFASCEMYRATGQFKYKKAIADYDTIPAQSRTCSDFDYTMLADVAYLSSNFKTDYARCEELMSKYRNVAADISGAVSRQSYYVQPDIKNSSREDILSDMMTLGLVSFILSGREYASIQANYLHYFFGINPEMTNYYNEPMHDGDVPLSSDIIGLSKLIFILGNGE